MNHTLEFSTKYLPSVAPQQSRRPCSHCLFLGIFLEKVPESAYHGKGNANEDPRVQPSYPDFPLLPYHSPSVKADSEPGFPTWKKWMLCDLQGYCEG